MNKRLIVCCDGTWQNLDARYPTNVVKIMQAIKPVADDKKCQIVFYDPGVGSSSGIEHLTGGAFGWGLDQNILDAYRFLCLNHEDGDQIYLFGFSRGSYTVRSLAGLIYASGLVSRNWIRQSDEAYDLYRDRDIHPEDTDAIVFREKVARQVNIDFLGCWDSVGSLGIPDQVRFLPIDDYINAKYKFHDTKLSHIIKCARHALAIDERRKAFDVTHMELPNDSETDLKEMWFAGDHSSIGGGSLEDRPLADVTLDWMMNECTNAGLGISLDRKLIPTGVAPDGFAPFDSNVRGIYWIAGTENREIRNPFEEIHESVKKRWQADSDYRPENLNTRFGPELDHWSETKAPKAAN